MSFVTDQFRQIKQGGWTVMTAKASRLLSSFAVLPLYFIAVPVVLLLRMIRPWFVVRFVGLFNSRIGHFAGNTELYLCERQAGVNIPRVAYADLCFMSYRSTANFQLARMWRRTLRIWPTWLIKPLDIVNRRLPGWHLQTAGENTRDTHNLLDRCPPHLSFTRDEETKGQAGLRSMGIPDGAKFVCILVRDSAYLKTDEWNYHSYRDSSIHNYLLAAEDLAARGYYVLRMGQVVRAPLKSDNPMIIDYASNGMRTDFMDIYLGAKCSFCITTGAGWDAIPSWLFRKPTIFTNLVPLGYIPTFSKAFLIISKRHIDKRSGRELSLSEIFSHNVGFCMRADDYETNHVQLVENTPEEIRDITVEMVHIVEGKRKPSAEEEEVQQHFWKIFPTDSFDRNTPLHGQIRSRIGSDYLLQNQKWIQ